MAEPTIILRSPVKSTTSSMRCSSPNPSLNSPTHNSTVIILKDSNNNDQQPHSSSPMKSSTNMNSASFPSLSAVQSKLYYAGHTGLYNLGNTCYVNCVLQLLSHVPQFCDAICSMSFESLGLEQPSDVPMVNSSHNPTRLKGGGRGLLKALEAQPRRVPCYLAYELHGTFNIIWSGKCMVYSPLNMIAAVRRLLPTFEPCAMEDAQEFLEALLAAVTDEIKANKLADTNIINDLLGFSSESQILCEQCHRLSVTKTDETFITLTFSEKMLCDARGSSRRRSCHLTEMLAHFYQWEALSTPFQCSNCIIRSSSEEGTKAQKRLLISKLPQVLHVVLRRFRSLPQTNLRRPTSRQARQLSHKITMHVNFDEYLDMAPYCTQSTHSKQHENSTNDCLYRLRGVVVHYGKSINTGHFVAFVYNDLLGEWLRCDDHIIEQTTFETVKTTDAYILVYSRCTSNSTSSSISSNPIIESVVCESHKRKRALSVDNFNEQKDEMLLRTNKSLIGIKRENTGENSNITKRLKFLCVNFDPLTSGQRRRTQSLNFAIRSNQPSIDSIQSNTFKSSPTVKRRRKLPIYDQSILNEYISPNTETHTKVISQQTIQTRIKVSSVMLSNTDLSSALSKNRKASIRRRRRADPFTRKRRIKRSSNKKLKNLNETQNLEIVPTTEQSLSISIESPLSSIQTSVSSAHENSKLQPSPTSIKPFGRVRIQRSINITATSAAAAATTTIVHSNLRSATSGDMNTRQSLPSQTPALLTTTVTSRRSNSLNNPISHVSNC